MPRKSPYPLQKVTLHLREGDCDKLAELLPQMPVAEAIREIVHAYISKVEETHEMKREKVE